MSLETASRLSLAPQSLRGIARRIRKTLLRTAGTVPRTIFPKACEPSGPRMKPGFDCRAQ